jgi:hypothetical protein
VSTPGELVEFFDGDMLSIGLGGELLDAAAEIADLVERVPGGQLQENFAMNVGNNHGHVKKMFGWFGKRDLVPNRGSCGFCAEAGKNEKAKRSRKGKAHPSLRSG